MTLSTHAQGTNRIRFGEIVSGSISDDNYRLLYTFSGHEGQVVSAQMTTTQGDLDPYLLIMDNNRGIIAISDDDGEARNATIRIAHLPNDGDYFVIATRFGHEHGTTSGRFDLNLEDIGSSSLSGAALDFGDRVFGRLDEDTYEQIYQFEAQRGQVVNIQLQRTSGSLDPLIDLFDRMGQPLETGDDDPTNPDSLNAGIINFLIPDDGVYYVRATRYGRDRGDTTGSYVLTLNEIPVQSLGTRPGNARLIEYGQTLTANIEGDIRTRFFRFEAERGDVVSVVVTRETGNLAPRVSLLAEDLRVITISPDAAAVTQARLIGTSLPETGTYYVAVSRFRGEEGTSVGEFSIELNGREGIGGQEALELVFDAEVTGVISDTEFVETYLFVGEANERVIITMRNVEGDLDPLITLRDETGKQLAYNDDISTTNKDAQIEFRLPTDGIYTVEASRFQINAGQTTGVYSLTLDRN